MELNLKVTRGCVWILSKLDSVIAHNNLQHADVVGSTVVLDQEGSLFKSSGLLGWNLHILLGFQVVQLTGVLKMSFVV